MRWRKALAVGMMAMLVAALAGCGSVLIVESKPGERMLQAFAEKLMSLKVYEDRGLVHISSGAGAESVFLQVRKKHDFDQPVTEQESEDIKEAIYKEVGFRVPLDLQVYVIGETPHITGKVTAMDGAGRLLIVEDKAVAGQDEGMPRAMWFKMAEDAVILKDGKQIAAEKLKIGAEVKGWHSGLVMESYPEQTEGLKIEVTGPGTSETGDLTGTVEEVSSGHADWMQNYIVVDGEKYQLPDFAAVLDGGNKVPISDLHSGDRVKLWFAGYSVGMENEPKMVTQIEIVR